MAGASPAAPCVAPVAEGVPVIKPAAGGSSNAATHGLMLGVVMLVLSQLLPWSAFVSLSLALAFATWWWSTTGRDDTPTDGVAGSQQAGARQVQQATATAYGAAVQQQNGASAAGGGGGAAGEALTTTAGAQVSTWLCCVCGRWRAVRVWTLSSIQCVCRAAGRRVHGA
jgi:hypothetical protein